MSQARWEDLQLLAPIPFQGSDTRPMYQTHRLQVTQARAGIVLTTKQHISELDKVTDQLEFALLIPTVDGTRPANLFQPCEGPFEITVEDASSKAIYKRLALMIVRKGKISYKLPEPKLKLRTAAVAELVLEINSRIQAKERPQQAFRQFICDIRPDLETTATFYGIRVTRHPAAAKTDQRLQCMLKIPYAARTALLEASGKTALLTRDFIDHTHEPTDTTILRIATQGIPGAAGLVATRRGPALRIWINQIAQARLALLPKDARLTEDNRHAVPKVTFQAAGWPPGTDPSSVVKSVLEATGVPTVPTRTFRAAGVHTWILTAEKLPSETRFSVDADGSTHEILLQQATQVTSQAKGQGKAKHKARGTNP